MPLVFIYEYTIRSDTVRYGTRCAFLIDIPCTNRKEENKRLRNNYWQTIKALCLWGTYSATIVSRCVLGFDELWPRERFNILCRVARRNTAIKIGWKGRGREDAFAKLGRQFKASCTMVDAITLFIKIIKFIRAIICFLLLCVRIGKSTRKEWKRCARLVPMYVFVYIP